MQQSQHKINILLVDDRRENLISLAAVLDRPDYRLVTAESGQEALKHLMEDEFALILLDVQMPDMDGFETATLIRQREKTKAVPIIFVTAISKEDAFVFKGYDSGAVDYILKPFEPHILRSKVAVFADLHRATLELREQSEKLLEVERLERDRKLAELEIKSLRRERAINEKYRQLVEGIPQGIVWMADTESFVCYFVNTKAEEISGCASSEWLSDSHFFKNHIYPDDQEKFFQLFARCKEEGEASLEHRFVKSNGEVIWLHTGISQVREDTSISIAQGLSVNITHLKTAQEIAEKAIKARDEFLSIASHELKTPITPLKLQTQAFKIMINRGMSAPDLLDKMTKFFECSDRQLVRLNNLIDELLSVSRINNGQLLLQLEETDLGELIKETSQRYSSELQKAACDFHLDAEEKVVGNWDRLKLEQTFVNLLTNAIRYASGKPIHVTVKKEGLNAVILVKDKGMGVSLEDQKRIFQRFERAISDRYHEGLGLGLFIASEIVKHHGGSLSVKSKGIPGSGSTFRIEIPLNKVENTFVEDSEKLQVVN